MKIEKTEKVILTTEEATTLNKALDIIDKVYDISNSKGELEKQTSDIITALTNFIDDAEIDLKVR